jgi:hypothetical protein
VQPVAVRILHPEAGPAAGPLERSLATARAANGEWLRSRFEALGADAAIVAGQPDGRPFGARLRDIARGLRGGGLVVLGSGAIPLATGRDLAAYVEAAASGERRALANNRYSADVVAIGELGPLRDLPDLPGDNALPRWLEEVAGFEVDDLRRRWRLGMDLDSPLDLVLLGDATGSAGDTGEVVRRLEAIRRTAADRRAELVLAGRTSATTLRWLEHGTASRVRALVEERGLRTSGRQAAGSDTWAGGRSARAPRSVLGMLLDERGAADLGAILAKLGDAAIVDSRVLLAHRLGADEAGWPEPEDRFASDLLLADRIADPWLRDLTAAARDAAIPVLLGGHSLVGPGIRLALAARR